MTSAFTPEAAGSVAGPAWLVDRRRAAAERFAGAELPTTDEEVWRYSRIGDLRLEGRRPVDAGEVPAPSAAVAELRGTVADAEVVVVTVDGVVADVEVSPGSKLRVLDEPGGDDSSLGAAFDRAFDAGPDPLRDLHDAFCQPVEVRVPSGTDAGRILVIHEFTDLDAVSFPRLVVVAEDNARATVTEALVSADGAATLAFPVTELIVGRDAGLDHASLQLLGDRSWSIGRLASIIGQNGRLRAGTAAFGSDYSRLRVDTVLDGRGAEGELFAGYFGTGSQLLDFRTFQDHAAPDTMSNLLFKGALADSSASVYTGLIKIRPEGRGTRAFQTNRNLKLSADAFAESVPNLEIENNEVQCSHASTVGPVDAEQRFYLESRGVPTERAERLIVRGMFDEIFEALALGGFEDTARTTLDRQLESTEFNGSVGPGGPRRLTNAPHSSPEPTTGGEP